MLHVNLSGPAKERLSCIIRGEIEIQTVLSIKKGKNIRSGATNTEWFGDPSQQEEKEQESFQSPKKRRTRPTPSALYRKPVEDSIPSPRATLLHSAEEDLMDLVDSPTTTPERLATEVSGTYRNMEQKSRAEEWKRPDFGEPLSTKTANWRRLPSLSESLVSGNSKRMRKSRSSPDSTHKRRKTEHMERSTPRAL